MITSDSDFKKGATWGFRLANIRVRGEVLTSLTGYKLWFTIKRKQTDTDAAAFAKRSTDASNMVVSGGQAEFKITPAETDTAVIGELLLFDAQIMLPNGDVCPLLSGEFVVGGRITHANS